MLFISYEIYFTVNHFMSKPILNPFFQVISF